MSGQSSITIRIWGTVDTHNIYTVCERPPGGGRHHDHVPGLDNAADMRRVVEPFKDAIEALERHYIALPRVTCIMSVLDSHIEAEIAA